MNNITRKMILDFTYALTHQSSKDTFAIHNQLIGFVKSLGTEKIITTSTVFRYLRLFNNIVFNKSFLRMRSDDDWNK